MSNLYKKIFSVIAILSLTGCVSVKQIPMTTDSATQIRNKEITIAQRDTPNFAASTPGKAIFGAIGAAAMVSAGNQIISQNQIEDPAIYISQKLTSTLSAKLGTRVSHKTIKINHDDVKKLAANNEGTDLVLDVKTINWSFIYFPATLNTYRVLYNARLRLIDAKNGTILVEGGCTHVPQKTPDAPSYEDLLRNNAARLKQELTKAANFCISEFESKALKI